MKLYSYIVARDYGFAPNPFFGVCTLATCKPEIRRKAQVGDWIVGTGSQVHGLDGRLVYAMKVAEILTYDEYWNDVRFLQKRPHLRGSLKQAYGDNIYHQHPRKQGQWIQVDSHHSRPDGVPNESNIQHDTRVPRVLVASDFVYWGGSGPKIPRRYREYEGFDICRQKQGHKCRFPTALIDSFIAWIRSLNDRGYIGSPKEFTL